MNEIAFVIATEEYGIGRGDGVEPIIDGVSVVDLFKRADGEISYAGLSPPERLLQRWQSVLAAAEIDKMKILGCRCGDPDCRWATARLEVSQNTVVWSKFWGSNPLAGKPGPRRYDEIGPYQFDLARYAAALATPVRANAPVREKHEMAALRAGIPSAPRAWLNEMTMAFGRDFITPFQPEFTRQVTADGLCSLIEAGTPMTDEAVRDWARDRRFSEEAIKRYVEWFREIGRRA